MTPIQVLHLEDSEADAELVQALLEEAGIACEFTRVETQAEFAAALGAGGFTLILASQPCAVRRPAAGAARPGPARRRGGGAVVSGPRPLQGGQRFARASGGGWAAPGNRRSATQQA